MSEVLLATGLALASALGFAFSTSLQHSAAGESTSTTVRGLIHDLVRTPVWLGATCLALVAQVLQMSALHYGTLTLVGPLMICSVVLAVIVRDWLDDRFPSHEELGAVLLVAAGIAVLLASANLSGTSKCDRGQAALLVLIAIAVAFVGHMFARRNPPRRAAVALAASGGFLFGVSAGLLKMLSESFVDGGFTAALFSWVAPAQVVVGLTATTLNQRAYQLAPLSVSMPLLNVVTVLVTLLFGWWVFAENPITSAGAFGVMIGGLAVIAAGLWLIADQYAEVLADPPRA